MNRTLNGDGDGDGDTDARTHRPPSSAAPGWPMPVRPAIGATDGSPAAPQPRDRPREQQRRRLLEVGGLVAVAAVLVVALTIIVSIVTIRLSVRVPTDRLEDESTDTTDTTESYESTETYETFARAVARRACGPSSSLIPSAR